MIHPEYLHLELPQNKNNQIDCIKLNSGRNCLEYIIKAKKIKKLFIPYYICESILQPVIRNNIPFEYYNIDKELNPFINKINLSKNEYILVVNYYGIKDKKINELIKLYSNIIVDASQAFFYKPEIKVPVFYSPRKFFGIPDGGLLYNIKEMKQKLSQDDSSERLGHLLKKIINPENHLKNFKFNEQLINNLSMMRMSKITDAILNSIDLEAIKGKYKRRFMQVHSVLSKTNLLKLNVEEFSSPLFYTYLTEDKEFRSELEKAGVKSPIYWQNVIKSTKKDSIERFITKRMVFIPVNHQIKGKEFEKILHFLRKYE